jgi:hypothetical protein
MQRLDGYAFPAYASPGAQKRAGAIANRCARARAWMFQIFDEHPQFTLIVADRHDWNDVALIPLYGMPHAIAGRLITGLKPADFWTDYSNALLDDLPAPAHHRLTAVYGDPPKLGERFADLVIAHELTHFFHEYDERTGLTDFPRLWVAELFANIGMHGYIASNEPAQLPALETICQLTREAPADRWSVRDLDRMEQSLAAGPLNYVWFQLQLLPIAKQIWQAGGPTALREFRNNLRQPALTDDQITERIQEIAPRAARTLRHWPASS